jgi:hypothetical protein
MGTGAYLMDGWGARLDGAQRDAVACASAANGSLCWRKTLIARASLFTPHTITIICAGSRIELVQKQIRISGATASFSTNPYQQSVPVLEPHHLRTQNPKPQQTRRTRKRVRRVMEKRKAGTAPRERGLENRRNIREVARPLATSLGKSARKKRQEIRR